MFKFKKSSPDKSVSLSRNPSLKGASNDTSTGTEQVLALKFKYFQDTLGALNQQYGDIQKIGTPLDQSSYTAAQAQYKILYNDIKKYCILKPEETKQLLFKIYEYQAVSAFRAGNFQEHNEHLLHAYNKYGPAIDKFIIGLERWVKIYKTLGANAKDVPSISPQYDSLLKKVETEVQLLIKAGGYDQARTKMKYLDENSHNFQIFDLYFSTIKDPNEALKYFEDKSKKYNFIRKDIHAILKKWQSHLTNQVNDKEVAAKAAAYVLKYNSNPTVATVHVTPAVRKVEKELEILRDKVEKASHKLETARTLAEQDEEIKELKAKHEAECEQLKIGHKAELEKANAEFNGKLEALKLEALKPKASPTKDTKVDEAGDSSTTSSLPPPYTSVDIANSPYLQLAQKTPSAPVVNLVTPLAREVLTELTKLVNSITSLKHCYYNEQYKIDKDKVKSILSDVVKNNPNVYKTISDPKILLFFADFLLSSNKIEEGRIVCQQAIERDPNIWKDTMEEIVLLNLAGVLLPSDQPKAEQIYSKVMNFRFICKNEENAYIVDTNRKMKISKIVAQDGYKDEERDCLANFCLSSPKVHQKVQALDCYPHTDATATKRQKIVEQLQQSIKQIPKSNPNEFEGKVYAFYTKLYPLLKESLEFCCDMEAEYKTLHMNSAVYIYPPTEEYTAKILGWCASNDS